MTTAYKDRKWKTGKDTWNWVGDKVSYSALHIWVRRNLGKPNKCEHCGVTEGTFEWANKSHNYKRDLEDWIRLCKKCHIKYDGGIDGKKVSEGLLRYWKDKWSAKSTECIRCKTTDNKHEAKGYCLKCYYLVNKKKCLQQQRERRKSKRKVLL